MHTPILETERLILRSVQEEDAKEIFKCWESDPEVSKYMFWESHDDINKTKEWVQMERDKIQDDLWYRWIIIDKESSNIMGTCLLYDKDTNNELHVGYNLGQEYWGKGYATEAVRESIEFAKRELTIKTFVGGHAIENEASAKVLEKLGFKYDKEIDYDCGPQASGKGLEYVLKVKKKGSLENKERTENFYTIKRGLESKGYDTQFETISVLKANLMAFVTAGPLAIVCFYIYSGVHKVQVDFTWIDFISFYALLFLSIPVHEFLHGLGWVFSCKDKWKSIQFGVAWKVLTPYCCCLETMTFKRYLLGGLLPLLVLGFAAFSK